MYSIVPMCTNKSGCLRVLVHSAPMCPCESIHYPGDGDDNGDGNGDDDYRLCMVLA